MTTTGSFVRLWLHETSRVYGDKLIEKKDQETFSKTIVEQIKKTFSVSCSFNKRQVFNVVKCLIIVTPLFNDVLHAELGN